MQFYILLPDDDFSALSSPNNVLGETSFDTFHAENGFRALRNIIMKYPQVLPDISIIDNEMKKYTVEEFLDTIKPYKLLIH